MHHMMKLEGIPFSLEEEEQYEAFPCQTECLLDHGSVGSRVRWR